MQFLRFFGPAVLLASGMAIAGSPAPANPDTGFVRAQQAATGSGHQAAARALDRFVQTVTDMQAEPGSPSRRHTDVLAPQAGLPGIGAGLPAGFPLAIDNREALANLTLGWGFAVHDVQPAKLLSGMRIKDSIGQVNQWRYAVMLHGKPVGLVTVARTAGGWQAVSFGGAGLSRDIATILAQVDNDTATRLRYVRVRQATADFIEVTSGSSTPRYVPLHAAATSLGLLPGARIDSGDLAARLRASVRRGLEATH